MDSVEAATTQSNDLRNMVKIATTIGNYQPPGDNPDDKRPRKKKRPSRNQRRKQKLIAERPERRDAREIIKENENLVKYYKEQAFFEEDSEFDKFMECLRTTLPASFRINTFDYLQAKILRLLVQRQFQEFLATKDAQEVENEETNSQDAKKNEEEGAHELPTTNIPTLDCLNWYPKNMAWQMNISRIDLRKSSILRILHKFIQAETDNGYISRQESVSMIPPLVLDIQKGQNILDMCAAPGSKTAQLLEYLKFDIRANDEVTNEIARAQPTFSDGLVVANDVDNKRCYMLVHQSSRLNSPNCVIINEDASRFPEMKTINESGDVCGNLRFDRILCDAPCTGDGTVRKNPDVWRKWTIGNANNFHGLQSKILKRGVELLKENGLIVYSTCSMNPVENEAVVANVLRLGQGKLVLEDCSERLKGLSYRTGLSSWTVMDTSMRILSGFEDVKPEQTSQLHKSLFPPSEDEIKDFNLHRCVRVFPHLQNTGAFFIALIKKLSPDLPHELNHKSMDGTTTERHVEEQRQTPKPKRRRYGFKEDPFIFLDSDDRDWKTIREFYGLVDGFPVNQLTHKCTSGKKRSIYLVSRQNRSFILPNQEQQGRNEFVKVINGGMRLFMRAETEAGFRICQDGVNEILPFINSDLRVPVVKNDLVELLSFKTVPFYKLSSSKHFEERLRVGSCVLMYNHTFEDDEKQNKVDIPTSVEMPLVAWRGERSVALYVSSTYRVHLRSLIQGRIVSDEADTNPGEKHAVPITNEEDNRKDCETIVSPN